MVKQESVQNYGQGTLTMDQNGAITRDMGNVNKYKVNPWDSKYDSILGEYNERNSIVGNYDSTQRSLGGGGGNTPRTNEPGFGNKGGGGGYSPAYDNGQAAYEKALKKAQQQAEEIRRQQEEAARLAVQQGVSQLEGNRTGINSGYDDLARQLYIERRQNERRLPQQLAAQGNTGGLTESTNLGLQTAYQNLLAQGERARVQELDKLNTAIANLQTSGDLSIAQQGAQISQNALNTYLDLFNQMQNDRRWGAEMAQNQQQYAGNQDYNQWLANQQLGLSQDQLAADQSNSDWNRALQLAQIQAGLGDFSGYNKLGLDGSSLQQAYQRMLADTSSSSGGSSRSSSGGSSSGGYSGFTDSTLTGSTTGSSTATSPSMSSSPSLTGPGMGRGVGLDALYNTVANKYTSGTYSLPQNYSLEDAFIAQALNLGYSEQEINNYLSQS